MTETGMNLDFLATHGQSNHLGRFVSSEPLNLMRGDRVVIETARGLEIGNILCPATDNHTRLLRIPPGRLVRRANGDDEQALLRERETAGQIFAAARVSAGELRLDIEILDVEVLLDGRNAVVQFLGTSGAAETLGDVLEHRYGLALLMENLAFAPAEPEAHERAGCGKPECGQDKEGGCTSCSSGGCSTGGCGTGCGTGGTKVDMRDYFAHLHNKMQSTQRVPLV